MVYLVGVKIWQRDEEWRWAVLQMCFWTTQASVVRPSLCFVMSLAGRKCRGKLCTPTYDKPPCMTCCEGLLRVCPPCRLRRVGIFLLFVFCCMIHWQYVACSVCEASVVFPFIRCTSYLAQASDQLSGGVLFLCKAVLFLVCCVLYFPACFCLSVRLVLDA